MHPAFVRLLWALKVRLTHGRTRSCNGKMRTDFQKSPVGRETVQSLTKTFSVVRDHRKTKTDDVPNFPCGGLCSCTFTLDHSGLDSRSAHLQQKSVGRGLWFERIIQLGFFVVSHHVHRTIRLHRKVSFCFRLWTIFPLSRKVELNSEPFGNLEKTMFLFTVANLCSGVVCNCVWSQTIKSLAFTTLLN